MHFLICIVCDDVINLAVCEFLQNIKILISENELQFLPLLKKIHWLHLKGCIMGKTSFLAELTFNWNAVLFSSFNGLSPLLSHKREILSDHSVNRHNATQLAADKLHLSDQLLKTKGVFITQSNIYNGSIFAKKSSIVMFCCVLSRPLKPFFHVERLAQLQLIPRFTSYFSILVN